MLRVDADGRPGIGRINRRRRRCREREACRRGPGIEGLPSTTVVGPRAASLAQRSQSPVSRIYSRSLKHGVHRWVVYLGLNMGTEAKR